GCGMWDRRLQAEEATMRGREEEQAQVMLGITPDALVPQDHPIRRMRTITDRALKEMSPVPGTMYPGIGRPSRAGLKRPRACSGSRLPLDRTTKRSFVGQRQAAQPSAHVSVRVP